MNADQTWKILVKRWLVLPLTVLLAIVVILMVMLLLCGFFLFRLMVLFVIGIRWTPRGISMLVVYSNSPHWQDYFEKGLLPLVGRHAMVLNWSERKSWPFSLSNTVFYLFKGEGHENPIIFLFKPFRWPTRLRFYQPFHDVKHGKYGPLCDLENELANWLHQPIDLTQYHPRKSV